MTIEELLARALYSERERNLTERRLTLEAERARRRILQGQVHMITRALRSDRDRATRRRPAARPPPARTPRAAVDLSSPFFLDRLVPKAQREWAPRPMGAVSRAS